MTIQFTVLGKPQAKERPRFKKTQKLKQLIIDNPDLPVIHWVHCDPNGDYGYELSDRFTVEVDSYVYYNDEVYLTDDQEQLIIDYWNNNDDFLYGRFSDDEQATIEFIEEYFKNEWIKAIIVAI